MTRPRYLTKSRYRMACECPTRLYYTKKPKKYKDNGLDDPFLQALRDGGFQVGELARQYYGKGALIDTLDEAEALQQTATEMAKRNALIFEAAFLYQNLFIRADIVQKTGDTVRLIEVKSKSIRPNDPRDSMLKKDGLPKSEWDLTLQDIAFQTYVLEKAHPKLEIQPFLMLADKEKQAVVDAMNSFFFLKNRGDRKNPEVLAQPLPPAALQKGKWILCEIPVGDVVGRLHKEIYKGQSFEQRAKDWADHYAKDQKIAPVLSSKCRDCQFRASPDERKKGLLSGYHECWRAVTGLSDADLDWGTVVEIWQHRGKDDLLQQGTFHQKQVKPEILTGSYGPRQQQQVTCVKKGITAPQVDHAGLDTALSRLVYPLHFIDFETIRAAIPFHKDSTPYEQVAFQFSHHVVEQDGTIRHAGEWINLERGKWPNQEFLTKLQAELSRDGSILHYANHEQQVLLDLASQVERSAPALASWARGLMDSSKADHGQGKGRMVDLRKILEERYYHPLAGGSNSLKKILPAILQTSAFLRNKYSKPVYGTPAMPSKNFKAMTWIQGKADPYELLPPVAADIPQDTERVFGENDKIDQGGAAMMAYAKAQFTQCSAAEVAGVEKALLKYCELDTLAMVMLWEEWKA